MIGGSANPTKLAPQEDQAHGEVSVATPVNLGASLRRALPASVDALRNSAELPFSLQSLVALTGTAQEGSSPSDAGLTGTQTLRCWEGESLEILSGEESVRRAWFGEGRIEWSERWGINVTDKVKSILRSGTPIIKASTEIFGDPVMLRRKMLIVELNGQGDWEALWLRRCAANDELCSENGRLRGEIERLRHEVEAAETDTDERPEVVKRVDDDLLACVLLATADAVAVWKRNLPPALAEVPSVLEIPNPIAEHPRGEVEDFPTKDASVEERVVEAQEDLVARLEQEAASETGKEEVAHDGSHEQEAEQDDGQTQTEMQEAERPLVDSEAQPEDQESEVAPIGNEALPGNQAQAAPEDSGTTPGDQEKEAELEDSAASPGEQEKEAGLEDSAAATESEEQEASPDDGAAKAGVDNEDCDEDDEAVRAQERKPEPDSPMGYGATRKASFHSCESALQRSPPSEKHQTLEGVEAAIMAVIANAFNDAEVQAHKALSSLSPAEETACLVHEKIALRELVEGQADRIVSIERELQECGAETGSPFLANVLAGGTLGGALSVTARGLSNLSDAGGAFSLSGLSAAIAARSQGVAGTPDATQAPPVKLPMKAAVIGAEYEVVGRRGAVVREGDDLRSELVADLPPGTKVRVVGLSEMDPRRVEIVACLASSASSEGAGGVAQDGDAPPSADAAVENGNESAAMETVLGWISAFTVAGHNLIRPISQKDDKSEDAVQPDSQEEGSQEIDSVTLSSEEWQLLHQDRERAMQRVSDLTAKLNSIASQLLQSFEMRTVLSEMQLTADRAHDRRLQMREMAAMTGEEVVVWRERWREVLKEVPVTPSSSSRNGLQRLGTSSSLGTPKAQELGERVREMEDVDWNKLRTERETTAATLSAALQRVATLRREADELEQEKTAADGRTHGELYGLRKSLRQLAGQARRLPSKLVPSSLSASQTDAKASSEAALGLFRNRIVDLEQQVRDLRDQIGLLSSTEVALQRTLDARRDALRRMLCRHATWDMVIPDCGVSCAPFGGTLLAGLSADAERKALRIAVEEQLQYNLQLTRGGSQTASRQLEILPTGAESVDDVDSPQPIFPARGRSTRSAT